MIYALHEEWAIPQILRMILNRGDLFKIKKNKLESYLKDSVKNGNSITLIDETNQNVDGVLFATITEIDGIDSCFIHCCIIDPQRELAGNEFMGRLINWSKSKGIENIFLLSNTHLGGFKRKYAFEDYSTMLKMNIDRYKEIRNQIAEHNARS